MMKTFKYRLQPNANQERELSIMLETHRRLYNAALDGKQLCWETAGVNWTLYQQYAWLGHQQKRNPYYARLNNASARSTLKKLDEAFKVFFRCIKAGKNHGYPRFKNKDRFNSFTFDVAYGGGLKVVDHKIRVRYVGNVRLKWHRPIPSDGRIKTATITRENDKWYVCFAVELPDPPKTTNTQRVGVDVGLSAFVTTSEGEQLGDSRILESNLKELRRRQRALSRCRRGSSTRKLVKKRVTTLHAKVRNTRRDMHHKVARSLVNRFGTIAVERLNTQGMVRNNGLARRISDAGWGQFINILSSKAEEAGGQVIQVDPRNTSQLCSACGATVEKDLSVRVHRCNCGLVLDRDVNAARNILARAEPGIANAGIA